MQTLDRQLHFEPQNPHQFLGLHPFDHATKVIRLYRPGSSVVHVELFGKMETARLLDPSGIFECLCPSDTTPLDYRVYHQSGLLAYDPYAFGATFGEVDAHLFSKGVHYRLYDVLGAHLCEHGGVKGTKFALWAPNAKAVALVSDFNHWNGRINPMRSMGRSGVWELFVPGVGENEKYKFEIHADDGSLKVKSDPYAFWSEMRPQTASITYDINRFTWNDSLWMENRKERGSDFPFNVYEVHLGSWKKRGPHFLNYRDIAHDLAAYCQQMGFSHVELMPVTEHPLDDSWGYQVTGFFSVTSRYGTPEDFQYFVNHLHQKGIGVILDWVPAHFPTNGDSLAQFDGSYLYEHADPRQGFHPHWNTNIFNFGRVEVSNFLIASALFWLDKMHIDGLRVDAVASMLYLDYGREEGEWIPNVHGGRENLAAIEFIKHLNAAVHNYFPKALMCAEESTSFRGVSHPLDCSGLGFDMKWNMGWMNDTLRYLHRDPIYRSHHQNDLTFSLIYAFSERFILPFSHDEVVHGKSSLLAKMPGDDWQKFANIRLLYGYQMCHPGKKLLFMGAEIGTWHEWSASQELPWDLLEHERHRQLQNCIKELNHFYREQKALWERDFDPQGFEWVDFTDHKNSVISYLRKGRQSYLLCVHNFSPSYISNYSLPLKQAARIQEVFNTDRKEYGGSGKVDERCSIHTEGVEVNLAPLATMIFEVQFL